MLILTRRTDEAIFIGDDIKIILRTAQNGQASLGIEAPKHIPIHREEVYERILAERQKHNPSEQFTKGETA